MADHVLIVLVNWKHPLDTVECLESLLRLRYPNFSVVVCDNGSNDDSIAKILTWARGALSVDTSADCWTLLPKERRRTSFEWQSLSRSELFQSADAADRPFITVVDVGENMGFAGGNNIGIRYAMLRPEVQYVWLLNNDTIVDPDCLSALVSHSESDRRIQMCGSTLLYYRRPGQVQALGGSEFNRLTGRCRHLGHGLEYKKGMEQCGHRLDYIEGASILISRAFVEQIGPMAEDYFLYFEELDWAERLRCANLGWTIGHAPDSIVYHKHGGSIGSNAMGRPSNLSLYYLTRSVLMFCARWRPLSFAPVALRLTRDAVRYWVGADRGAAKAIARAARDFVLGNFGRANGKMEGACEKN